MSGDDVRSLERGLAVIRSLLADAPPAPTMQTSHTLSSR
jgi:hypothetical protein